MYYDESLKYLFSLGRNSPPDAGAAAKFDLENISTIAEALGIREKILQRAHRRDKRKGIDRRIYRIGFSNCGFGPDCTPRPIWKNQRTHPRNGVEISDEEFAAALQESTL